MDRKSFIINTGRWSLLAMMAGLVWFLVSNRKVRGPDSCAENQFCENCNKFGSCNLPQAQEKV